ncbi:TetR/AcrR family transcriptional regulator [Aureimonas ureilytica]|uniref:TetR/AcrR family transcriptional regulator n=1 Tax=Aureimonas ureilytica TaxID=401562 RepID=UPI0003605291|nr:TetR/AcrR family transcriptional regulator [Aureimonas ureilytica]
MAPEATKATRKPRADSLKNRERLLVAAADVFRAGGEGASLEAVARRAGVGIGTLYRHFPTREALFEAVYRREVDQLTDLARQLTDAEEPVAALRQWLHAGVGMVATKRGMLSALAIAMDGASDLQAYSLRHLTAAIDLLLGRAVASGAIRPDIGPDDLLQTLIGLCLMGRQPGWEAGTMRLIDVFVDGLRLPNAG